MQQPAFELYTQICSTLIYVAVQWGLSSVSAQQEELSLNSRTLVADDSSMQLLFSSRYKTWLALARPA